MKPLQIIALSTLFSFSLFAQKVIEVNEPKKEPAPSPPPKEEPAKPAPVTKEAEAKAPAKPSSPAAARPVPKAAQPRSINNGNIASARAGDRFFGKASYHRQADTSTHLRVGDKTIVITPKLTGAIREAYQFEGEKITKVSGNYVYVSIAKQDSHEDRPRLNLRNLFKR